VTDVSLIERLMTGPRAGWPAGAVHAGTDGHRPGPAALGRARLHMHQTRHPFACCYLEQGGSLLALQRILGRGTVTLTEWADQPPSRPNQAVQIRRK